MIICVKVVIIFISDFKAGGWKRAEPAPISLNKPSASRQPVGATGRTDWASK